MRALKTVNRCSVSILSIAFLYVNVYFMYAFTPLFEHGRNNAKYLKMVPNNKEQQKNNLEQKNTK